MPDLQAFLDEQGSALMHRAVREFDESKVKRKGGKFAKKAGPNDVQDEKADEDWNKPENLNATLNKITKDVGPAFSEVVGAVVKKFKLKSRADLKNNPEARAEAVKAAVQVLNNYAENRGKSPSGAAQIQYRVGNHGHIIAGVVTKDGYKVIPKNTDTSLRLESSAPPRATSTPTSTSSPDTRPTSTTTSRPINKPATQRPSASEAVDKKPNPFRNVAALERRADRQVSATGEIDDTLQKILDKVKKRKLKHDELELTNFLEHHGIKGMRWGVRRTDDQLGRVARLKAKFSRKKVGEEEAPKAKSSGGDTKPEGGDPKSSGGSSEHIAVDHERFVKSLSKSPEQMSDQELREASNRAQAIQNYQRLFAPENKSQMQKDVERMNLEKQYRDLNAQLNPPQKSSLAKLASGAQKGFNTFQTVDKALGGDLSKAVSRKLGLKPEPTEHEKAKAAADLAKWKATSAKNTVELHKLAEEHDYIKLSADIHGVPAPKVDLATRRAAWEASIAEDKAGAAAKAAATVTSSAPKHRAPTWLDNLRAANHKPSNDLPTLDDIYKAERKNRQPDLLTQVKKGRHRK